MGAFGNRLKKLLKTLNLSQIKSAEITDSSQSSISAYISGKFVPNMIFIEKIGKRMNINLNWLVLGEGEMFKTKEENFLTIPPEDRPKEQIIKQLNELWAKADPDERVWLKIELKKKFLEFTELLDKMDKSRGEIKKNLDDIV